MAKAVNDLGGRAKAGKLKPDDTHKEEPTQLPM
jgi:pyruvate/2-oxoglutarate dehydrogenase complex dihydrolipoamide acyltransferase (E2) component